MIIYHHLGLGDHIICNGLVRYLYNKHHTNEEIYLVVKERNYKNVKRMFDDINIKYIILLNESPIIYKIDEKQLEFIGCDPLLANEFLGHAIVRPGHEKCHTSFNFDKLFYDNCNISFDERWNSFYIRRDYEKEVKFYNNMNLKENEEYIFIHNQSTSGIYQVDIKTNTKTIYVKKTEYEESIFDWLTVIEKAKEIYCINSSFIHLIDSINIDKKVKLHHICVNEKNVYTFTLKNKWKNI